MFDLVDVLQMLLSSYTVNPAEGLIIVLCIAQWKQAMLLLQGAVVLLETPEI